MKFQGKISDLLSEEPAEEQYMHPNECMAQVFLIEASLMSSIKLCGACETFVAQEIMKLSSFEIHLCS